MNYFDASESRDAMIKITAEDQQEANQYVDALLTRLGVTLPLSKVPYEVRRLAIAIAHKNRALLMSGRGSGPAEADAYMGKYKAYDAEARAWEAFVTPELIMGKPQKSVSFALRRA